MKEAWKKSWKYLLILPIIAVAVVGVILTLPDGETKALSVSASDIVLRVGEEKALNYSVNIKQAVCSFEVEDETKANIDESEKMIVGLSEGATELTVTAKYGNETSVVTVSVTVIENNTPNLDTPSEPENPNIPDETEPVKDSEKIKVIFNNNEVDELVLNLGESYNFRLESEERNFTFKNIGDIIVTEITTGYYKIIANTIGYHTLTIQTPSYQRTIEVIVNSQNIA